MQFWRQLVKAFRAWQKDDGSLMAASVAYYSSLSMFPLLLVLIAGLGMFFQFSSQGTDAKQHVVNAISEYASPSVGEDVGEMLAGIQDKSAVGGPIGLAGLLFAAVTIFANFERAFDRIWNTEDPKSRGIWGTIRNVLLVRLRAFLLLTGIGGMVLLVFVAGMVLASLRELGDEYLPFAKIIWQVVPVAVSVALNTLVFTLLFRFLPRESVDWRAAAQGGLLTSVAWEIGRAILAAFLIGNKYSAYGVVGSFLAIMLWIYYAASIIFLGAEYVQVACAACRPTTADRDG